MKEEKTQKIIINKNITMNKLNKPYRQFHFELDGYDYFLNGKRIYRFELYLRGIKPQDIFSGRTRITFKEKIKEPAQ